ncbi:hypothetical protein C0995_006397 [Termitomyces sp. Mi166|nr:hypothetical protein C0995_006397 [Termitomyces sp. Mi166\
MEGDKALPTEIALSSLIGDGQKISVQQEWLIKHVAIEQAQFLEIIHTHHALINTTTWSTGAIHKSLGQSEHPIVRGLVLGLSISSSA